VACWSIVGAFVTGATGETTRAAAGAALGLAVAPTVFVVVAIVSGHPTPVFASAAAVLAAGAVALPLLAIRPDAVTGLVGGLGAGVAVAMRRPRTGPSRRAVAVGAVTAVEAVLAVSVPIVAVTSAPVLPLIAVVVADAIALDPASDPVTPTT
jgi:hypothetical protein